MSDEFTLADVAVALDRAGKDVVKHGSIAILKAGSVVVGNAYAKCPVDTGAMRDSISMVAAGGGAPKVGDLVVDIGPETFYAPLVEYGTVRMAPRPVMHAASENAAEDIEWYLFNSPAAEIFASSGVYTTESEALVWSADTPSGKTYTGVTGTAHGSSAWGGPK